MVKITLWLMQNCNQLFESKWDLYADNEFSLDWKLIYLPLQSDEVWLSQPELWYRKKKMQTQFNWHEKLQCIWV